MDRNQEKEFSEFVNKYGFFHNGKLSVEINGKIYSVEACVRMFNLIYPSR